MQIKTTIRYYSTPTRKSLILRLTKEGKERKREGIRKKFWQGYGKIGTLIHCQWACKMVQPLQKKFNSSSIKLSIELPDDPSISFLGIYLKEMKTRVQTKTCNTVKWYYS